MTYPNEAPIPINVAESVIATQAKAQLRLAIAAIAGAIAGSAFGRHYLPADLFNAPLLDAVSAVIVYAIASRWSWAKNKLVHSRFWALAINPAVPNSVIRPAKTGTDA